MDSVGYSAMPQFQGGGTLETQLFLWTGKIIWWAICCSAVACAVAGGILAPIVIRRKIIKHVWHWILTAELAKYGVSVDDLLWIGSVPEISDTEREAFTKVGKRLHERHEALEARKAL